MKMTALDRYRDRVQASNKTFRKMSAGQKRVQIAKDVLAQIKLKHLRPKCGSYFLPSIKDRYRKTFGEALGLWGPEFVPQTTEVRDIIGQVPSCDVCAIGAVFTAAVDRCDKLTIGEMQGAVASETISFSSNRMREYLAKFFPFKQLVLIEDAFERGEIVSFTDISYEERRKACQFTKARTTPLFRMTKIMKNIIANKGTFKP